MGLTVSACAACLRALLQHLDLINGYFQYAGKFKERQAWDISAKGPGSRDPMFIVVAEKA